MLSSAYFQTLDQAEEANAHYCDTICCQHCDYSCGNKICLDDPETYERKDLGDSLEYILICHECDERDQQGEVA